MFEAPPGLPRVIHHRGLTVRFASQYPDADSLIEELIDQNTAPRRLTVVSSDHRLQRAAQRRRAKPMDCDAWYAGVIRRRRRGVANSRRARVSRPSPFGRRRGLLATPIRRRGGVAELGEEASRRPAVARQSRGASEDRVQ